MTKKFGQRSVGACPKRVVWRAYALQDFTFWPVSAISVAETGHKWRARVASPLGLPAFRTASQEIVQTSRMKTTAFLSGGERARTLVVFDKDGTLIDFHAMWGGWITTLARRLEAASYVSVAPRLFHSVGFDPVTGAVDAHGP